VSRLPRTARPAAGARFPRVPPPRVPPRSHAPRRARAGLAAVAAVALTVGLAGCDGGAIGQDTEQSNGQSFVSGSGATYFPAGSRSPAPAVSGTSLTGQHLTLAGYRGHIVVLNFWGSWCGPCRQEAPSLGALARYFQLAGVKFLGVDIQDTPSAGIAFLRTFRIGYPSLNDPNDEIALEFHGTVPPTAIPSTLLIDRSGDIAARVVGGVTYDGLKRLITEVAAGRTTGNQSRNGHRG
jgi:thiol-disulfide isomerase/thioredoxin